MTGTTVTRDARPSLYTQTCRVRFFYLDDFHCSESGRGCQCGFNSLCAVVPSSLLPSRRNGTLQFLLGREGRATRRLGCKCFIMREFSNIVCVRQNRVVHRIIYDNFLNWLVRVKQNYFHVTQ